MALRIILWLHVCTCKKLRKCVYLHARMHVYLYPFIVKLFVLLIIVQMVYQYVVFYIFVFVVDNNMWSCINYIVSYTLYKYCVWSGLLGIVV